MQIVTNAVLSTLSFKKKNWSRNGLVFFSPSRLDCHPLVKINYFIIFRMSAENHWILVLVAEDVLVWQSAVLPLTDTAIELKAIYRTKGTRKIKTIAWIQSKASK